jgi:hypothetical protein
MANSRRNVVTVSLLAASCAALGACQILSGLSDYKDQLGGLDSGGLPDVADVGPADVGPADVGPGDSTPPKGSKPATWANFRFGCYSGEGCSLSRYHSLEAGTFFDGGARYHHDEVSGLYWLEDTGSALTFEDAAKFCSDRDARVPTRIEIVSLLRIVPSDTTKKWRVPFSTSVIDGIWTSSPAVPFDGNAPRFYIVFQGNFPEQRLESQPTRPNQFGVICIR